MVLSNVHGKFSSDRLKELFDIVLVFRFLFVLHWIKFLFVLHSPFHVLRMKGFFEGMEFLTSSFIQKELLDFYIVI